MCTNSFVTKEFLEHIFQLKVGSFLCEVGTKPGDNYLSTITNVQVNLIGKDGKTSVEHILVKAYPENKGQREFLDSSGLFATEYLVYDEFLPALNKIADEANNKIDGRSEAIGVNSAKFYGGNIIGLGRSSALFETEPWISENFIILKDLRPDGFKMLDRLEGLNVEQCLLTMGQLANLHALSWIYKQRNQLDYLVTRHSYLKDAMYREGYDDGWRGVVENFNKNALEVIREEFGESSEIFLRLQALFARDTIAILRMYLSGKGVDEIEAEQLLRVPPQDPLTLKEPWLVATHGDCWINNLLFTFANSDMKKPTSVVFVDQQVFREACLTTDLTHFIYSSARPFLRKERVDLLLQTYFNKFVEICDVLNERLPEGFTYDNLMRRWRRARVFALLMSIVFISFLYKPTDTESEKSNKTEEVGVDDNATSSSTNVPDAYAGVLGGTKNNIEWRKAIIETVLAEYEDGVL